MPMESTSTEPPCCSATVAHNRQTSSAYVFFVLSGWAEPEWRTKKRKKDQKKEEKKQERSGFVGVG